MLAKAIQYTVLLSCVVQPAMCQVEFLGGESLQLLRDQSGRCYLNPSEPVCHRPWIIPSPYGICESIGTIRLHNSTNENVKDIVSRAQSSELGGSEISSQRATSIASRITQVENQLWHTALDNQDDLKYWLWRLPDLRALLIDKSVHEIANEVPMRQPLVAHPKSFAGGDAISPVAHFDPTEKPSLELIQSQSHEQIKDAVSGMAADLLSHCAELRHLEQQFVALSNKPTLSLQRNVQTDELRDEASSCKAHIVHLCGPKSLSILESLNLAVLYKPHDSQ